MFQVTVEHSLDPDSEEAANDLIRGTKEKLPEGADPHTAILLISEGLDPSPILKKIGEAFPNTQIVGCSSDGEIAERYAENSAVLTTLTTDKIRVHAGVCRRVSDDVESSVAVAMSGIPKGEGEPKLCLVWPESLTCGGDVVVNALNDYLGGDTPIFGGLSADQWKFAKTYQFFGQEVLSDSAPFLLFYGDSLAIGHGVESGWKPITKEGIVTDSDGNILKEVIYEGIAGTGLDFYEHYLKGRPDTFGEFPIQVTYPDGSVVLRAPLQVTNEGYLFCAGNVPTGSKVRITATTGEEALEATEKSVREAIASFDGSEIAALMLTSCAARHYLLGPKTKKELENAQKAMKTGTPVFGGYLYGEIAPYHNGRSCLHNETVVTLVMGEK